MNLEFCVFVKLNTFLGLLAKINCFENLDSKKKIDFTERKFSWNLGLFQWTLDEVAVGILSFILILFVHLSSPVNLIIIITIEGLPHLSGFWFAKSNLFIYRIYLLILCYYLQMDTFSSIRRHGRQLFLESCMDNWFVRAKSIWQMCFQNL